MKDNIVLKKNSQMITRKIGSDILLIPAYENSTKKDSLYSLNNEAAEIWKSIDGINNIMGIKEIISKKYDLTRSAIKRFNTCLADLKKIKAVL